MSLLAVLELNSLQNAMMLMPCGPSAGPTGGAGLALPAWSCSLTMPETFFAMTIPLLLRRAAIHTRAVVNAMGVLFGSVQLARRRPSTTQTRFST